MKKKVNKKKGKKKRNRREYLHKSEEGINKNNSKNCSRTAWK